MEVEVEYTGTETERKLAELEQKTERQKIEIDDEVLKEAIQKKLVSFRNGLMRRQYVIDSNGNLMHVYSREGEWEYADYGKIQEIVAEMVRLKRISDKNKEEQQLQKQEAERRQKEVEAKKSEARAILADEITAMQQKIRELETEVKRYKEAEERRKKQAEEQENQEKIRKIEAKGFKQIDWDGEKYKEVNEYFDDYETLERVRLIDDNASFELWKDRDTEETITVYYACGKYFVK